MRYALYLLMSICLLVMLACLTYFSFLALIALVSLLEGYSILLGFLLAFAALLYLRKTLRLLRQRRIALATVTRLTVNAAGCRTCQLQFTARNDQTVLAELSSANTSFWDRALLLFLDVFDAQPSRGSRFPLLYDVNLPDKNPQRLLFMTTWLGPILLFWFAVLLILFGFTLWFSL
jgi:hypothetical protein